jgi:hypothetical protein
MKPAPVDNEATPHTLVSIARNWNRFWFTPADPTLLGFMRIAAGLITLYVHLAYCFDLQEFFGPNAWVDKSAIDEIRHEFPNTLLPFSWDDPDRAVNAGSLPTEKENAYMERWPGSNPREVSSFGKPIWSIWFHVTDPRGMVAVHCGVLAVMFMFTIGFCTRVTSVLTWVGAISYIQRAPTTLFGMDTMMNLLLIYLMIGPSGAALSVDRLIARCWATWRALRSRRPPPQDLTPVPRVSANLAIRLIQVNLCIIYLASGLSKLEGQTWWNFEAVWGTMANPEFSPMGNALYMAGLKFLCVHRWLWHSFMAGGVLFTLVMEISFPFLVWNPRLRWIVVSMGLMLHTGIAMFMGLNTFSLFMVTMLMSFVPPEAFQRLLARPGQGAPILQLAYSSHNRSHVRIASLVRAFDAWDQVHLVDLHNTRSRVSSQALSGVAKLSPPAAGAETGNGQHLLLINDAREEFAGYELFKQVVRSVRLLWPIAAVTWLPGVASLASLRYPGIVAQGCPDCPPGTAMHAVAAQQATKSHGA